jgi:hypothetical protein
VTATFSSSSLPPAASTALASRVAAPTAAALPQTWRSEAFAEDVFDVEQPLSPTPPPSLGVPAWLFRLAPVLVLMVGVAFAVVPPLA